MDLAPEPGTALRALLQRHGARLAYRSAAVLLASDESACTAAQTLNVDGGNVMS